MTCDVCFSSSSSGWWEATCGLCSVICDCSQRRQHHTAMQLLVWAWAQLAKRGPGQVVLAVSYWGTGDGRAGGDRLPQSHFKGVQVGEKSKNEFVNLIKCVLSVAAWLYSKLTRVLTALRSGVACISDRISQEMLHLLWPISSWTILAATAVKWWMDWRTRASQFFWS